MKNQIFEVDIEGLRELQSGKPKWVIVRELLQNAMDEDITECHIDINYTRGKMKLLITDDSPEGFRDLADMYTLFKDTYKRGDVKKRGRFNFGEKQVLALATYARITSTKGGYEFDMVKGTKKKLRHKRARGSAVYIEVKMAEDEFHECAKYCHRVLVSENIKITIEVKMGKLLTPPHTLSYKVPYRVFKAILPTELKVAKSMRKVSKETEVHIHEAYPLNEKFKSFMPSYIYEMGIPICEIDCDYSIDVQQKVPLSSDRDTVDAKYLKLIYGEVLSNVVGEIKGETCSNMWVREGFTSCRATKESRQQVIEKRFGEKVLIANPMDKRSMDEAMSNNYNVVYGAEMNKEEWEVVRNNNLMESTSAKFKMNLCDGKMVEPDTNQKAIAQFCYKVAKEFLGLDITISFYDASAATVAADFDSEHGVLRFNVARLRLTRDFWNICRHDKVGYKLLSVSAKQLDLIIHELGHSAGLHYEQSYHDCITMLGSKLTLKAIEDPEWFELRVC